ncbi:MAG TPA: hypothetical protein VIR31_05930 [Nitrososphaeraceae archaeon]
MEQIQKKKKRKTLLIRALNPLEKDIDDSLSNFEKKLIKIFKYHIGKDNAISQRELFEKITGKEPDSIDVFKRAYLWNFIKATLSRLRSSEVLFVVSDSHNFYVLSNMEEYKTFERKVDNLIEGLKDTKNKARRWVEEGKYRYMQDY